MMRLIALPLSLLFLTNGLSAQGNIEDPAFLCETTRNSSADQSGESVNVDFYIVAATKNLVMEDGNLFFGGSSFYFFGGLTLKGQFLKFSEEESLEQGVLGINLLDNHIVTVSNIEADRPSATFDIQFEPNGFASLRHSNWKGSCRQVRIEEEPQLLGLQKGEERVSK